MAEQRVRLYVYLTPEMDKEFREYAHRFGLTNSQFGVICITAGMNAIKRAVEPEKTLGVDDWAKVLQAGDLLGKSLEMVRDK